MRSSILGRFLTGNAGNFGLLMALLAVPLLLGVGVAIDYSRLSLVRSELQSAADSAALAAISKASETFKSGGDFNENWSKKQAEDEAMGWFASNHSNQVGYSVTKAEIDIRRNGSNLVATVEAAANVDLTLMRFANLFQQKVGVRAVASSMLAPYLDVHVLTDNSPSMALGATPADISALQSLTGCAFACHDLSGAEDTYTPAVGAGIPLRIDATREALGALISTMQSVKEQTNQFRMSAYHFGNTIEQQELTSYVPQTSDMAKAKSQTANLHLMTVPYANYNKNMATDFKKMLEEISEEIGVAGTGETNTDRQQLLMLVTDGVNTTFYPSNCVGTQTPWGQCQTPIDPSWCSVLKEKGVHIAVLYTTYYPVGDPWYNEWIKPFHDEIAPRLQQCASEGLFAQVEPHQGIKEAMEMIFFANYPQPRLVN